MCVRWERNYELLNLKIEQRKAIWPNTTKASNEYQDAHQLYAVEFDLSIKANRFN